MPKINKHIYNIPVPTIVVVARHLIKNHEGAGTRFSLEGIERVRQTLIVRAEDNKGLEPLLKEFNAHFNYGE